MNGFGIRVGGVLSALLLLPWPVAAENWPGWRGPTGLGMSREKDLPLTWDGKTGKNVLWKVLLHGGAKQNREMNSPGWSCPIVWGDRVFITTAVWPPELPERDRRKQIPAHHVLCFRASDGKQLWDTLVPPGPCLVGNHYHGYAVPTPATDGEQVYALFGSAVLAALDFEGNIIWREVLPHPKDVDGGVCSSPVLFKDSVIVVGLDNVGLRALDRKTGKVKWEQKTRDHNRMSTPALLPIDGRVQLVHLAGGVQGLDPDTGDLLWFCRTTGSCASPLYGEGLIYVDAGRGGRTGAAIDPRGKGDLTKTNVKWQAEVTCAGGSSGIIVGDQVYRVSNDKLRSWKLGTGELVYEEKLPRLTQGASPVATADGRIYIASSGRSYVVRAGPKFELLATNDLGEGDDYVTPAVSGGRIFIKGKSYLWCIGEK